jgi:hypothetical protein
MLKIKMNTDKDKDEGGEDRTKINIEKADENLQLRPR